MNDVQAAGDNLKIILDSDYALTIFASPCLLLLVLLILVSLLVLKILFSHFGNWRTFELNEVELGIGNQKIKLRPNDTDRQIAYKIWVELSTRKIGIYIDLDNDVISEIYDSWYNFFTVTRELIKEVPVSKFRRKDTERVIRLSIDVLNKGIRPHLTRWQARFRRWYDNQLLDHEKTQLHPQDIQKEFPEYEELKNDLISINNCLIEYREMMYKLISGL